MVVVKGDAYGHGRIQAARAAVAAGAKWLGSLDLETAFVARDEGGIPEEIGILAWLYGPGADFEGAIRRGVSLSVGGLHELGAIADAAGRAGRPARIHLKIDTGLHRLGVDLGAWPELVRAAAAARDRGLVEIEGGWTHVPEVSEEDDLRALGEFRTAIGLAARLGVEFPIRHFSASAAGHLYEEMRFDLVRMGGHSYGIPAVDGLTPREMGLIPVMTLRAQVLSVDGEFAWIAAGYGDGVPTAVAGRVAVAIDGARYPLVAVERDRSAVPIGDVGIAPGVIATLFGSGASGEQTIREWGDAIGTLGDEIAMRIQRRVPRRYVPAQL